MSWINTGAQLDGGEGEEFVNEIRFGPNCLVYIDNETASDKLLSVNADGDIRFTDIAPVDDSFITNATGTESIYCRTTDMLVTGTFNFINAYPFILAGDIAAPGEFLQIDAGGAMIWGPNSGDPAKIISPNLLTYVEVLDNGHINLVGDPYFFGTTPWTINGTAGTADQVISVDAGGSLVWRSMSALEIDYTAGTNIVIDAAARTIATTADVVFNQVTTQDIVVTAAGQLTVDGTTGTAHQHLAKTPSNELAWVTPSTGGTTWEPVGGSNIIVTLDPILEEAVISLDPSPSISSLTVAAQIDCDVVDCNIVSTQLIKVTTADITVLNLKTGPAGGLPRAYINMAAGAAASNVLVADTSGFVSWAPLGSGGAVPVSGQNIQVVANSPAPGDYTINLYSNITTGLNLLHANTQITSPSGHFDTLRCNISASIRDLNFITVGASAPRVFINGTPGPSAKNVLVGNATGQVSWEPLVNTDAVSAVAYGAGSALYNSIAVWPTGSEHVMLAPANQSATLPAAFYLLQPTASTNFSGSVRFQGAMFANAATGGYLIFGVAASSSTVLRGHVYIHSKIVAQSTGGIVANPIVTVIPFGVANAIKTIRVAASGGAYGYFPSGDMTIAVTYITTAVIDVDITLYTTNSPNTVANYLSGGALNQNGLA